MLLENQAALGLSDEETAWLGGSMLYVQISLEWNHPLIVTSTVVALVLMLYVFHHNDADSTNLCVLDCWYHEMVHVSGNFIPRQGQEGSRRD